MAKYSGGQLVVKALEDEGIRFTFGIPGTHNIGLYDELAGSSSVRPILVTDEQSAPFMADAIWRSTGELACVNVVPGAGLTHALSGIAEAFMDNVAMLVLGCGVRSDTGTGYQVHDIDQKAVVRPVVKDVFRADEGSDIYTTIRRACQLARAGVPGPVFVEVPAQHYIFQHEVPALQTPEPAPAPPAPSDAELGAMVDLLATMKRPLLYLGAGARGAGQSLVELAHTLTAPVATTFQGKGVYPEDDPLFLWNGYGPATPAFVQKIAASCDGTLAIGCRFGEVATASFGSPPPGPLIHVDLDPEVPNRNFKAKIAVTADAEATVTRLLGAISANKTDHTLHEDIHAGHQEVWQKWLRPPGDESVTPARLLSEVQKALGRETVFTTDSGNGTFLAMECLRLTKPGCFLGPVDYSCMGYSVPGALGAALAQPGRPVAALAGDGAFLMTGLELLTAVREKLPVAIFILRDGELAQIGQFQKLAYNRKASSELLGFDLSGLCRSLGLECVDMPSDKAITSVLTDVKKALNEGRPIAVNVAIDYSQKTYFTKGVVKTNFLRLPWSDRLRFVGRAVKRAVTG